MPETRALAKVLKMMADAVLSQANPVSGTQYTVLNTVTNARILSIAVFVTWTVQPTPLEVWITIDGMTWRFYFINPVSATTYICRFFGQAHLASEGAVGQVLSAASDATNYNSLEGKSIKIEVETTGGTVQNLDARVKYALW